MTPHFVGKTSLAGLRPVWVGDRPVLTQFPRLSELLKARLDREAATIFAEPLVTPATADSLGSVSWYAPSSGQPEPLPLLSPDRRDRAEAKLRSILARLAPLQDDPEIGSLLRAALAIASPEHILSIDGGILLTGWGLVPADQGADGFSGDVPSPLVLLPYMPPSQTSAVSTEMNGTATAAVLPAAPSPPGARSMGPDTGRAGVLMPPNKPARGTARLIPAALLVAAMFLAFGLWLGTLAMERSLAAHPQTAMLADPASLRTAIDQQSQENASLEQDIELRQKALQGNVCTENPAAIPSLGPDRAAPVPPAG